MRLDPQGSGDLGPMSSLIQGMPLVFGVGVFCGIFRSSSWRHVAEGQTISHTIVEPGDGLDSTRPKEGA